MLGKIQAAFQTGSIQILQIKCITVSSPLLVFLVAERVGTILVARTRRSLNKGHLCFI